MHKAVEARPNTASADNSVDNMMTSNDKLGMNSIEQQPANNASVHTNIMDSPYPDCFKVLSDY
ncbi:hypothetical protein GCM10011356_16100 [Kangiella profundi]|nr:hypothetical protein GCM10011356_16100 [Kangiella profundi]